MPDATSGRTVPAPTHADSRAKGRQRSTGQAPRRLFVAIDLPVDKADTLKSLRVADLQARWTPASQYHVTLRFLGETDDERAAALQESLRAVAGHPMELQVEGIDVFPSRRSPRVLVARVPLTPELKALQANIDRVALDLGFERATNAFNPHVTFARLKRVRARDVRKYVKGPAPEIEPFRVEAFHLYRSDLGPEGAVHTVVESYPLEG